MTQEKESFISSEERPEVGLKPDTPISELRVRDLQALLQGVNQNKGLASRWPEFKGPNLKPEKYEYKNETKPEWKDELKDLKYEKNEYKNETKPEWKDELKDLKYEKNEVDIPRNLVKPTNEIPRFGGETVSPAAIDQLIRTVSGLSEQVTTLTQEVEKLKQQPGGG